MKKKWNIDWSIKKIGKKTTVKVLFSPVFDAVRSFSNRVTRWGYENGRIFDIPSNNWMDIVTHW